MEVKKKGLTALGIALALTLAVTACARTTPTGDKPPKGPGAEIGRSYPFSLYVHCGVRDARFDGRWWMANPMLSDPPVDWTPDDSLVLGSFVGEMTMVAEDLAVFTAKSGRSIEFIPWPSDVERWICYD